MVFELSIEKKIFKIKKKKKGKKEKRKKRERVLDKEC